MTTLDEFGDRVRRMRILYFNIPGIPVPYTRMTQKSKYVAPQARRYNASQKQLAEDLGTIMIVKGYEKIEKGVPLKLGIDFVSVGGPDHRKDLSNLVKAVEDACNGIVWDDDRWVDEIDAQRIENLEAEGDVYDMTLIHVFVLDN